MVEPVLTVASSAVRWPERHWVLEQLLRHRLGLDWCMSDVPPPPGELHLIAPGGRVICPDLFFPAADRRWRLPASLPAAPLPMWSVPAELRDAVHADALAMPWGDGRFERSSSGPSTTTQRLPFDLAGSAFFMLSRYEEAVEGAPLDAHGRFPGRASAAARSGLTDRPLVDEWLALLAHALEPLLPAGTMARARQAPLWVTCDVDLPFAPGATSLRRGLRQAASDIVNERRWRDSAATLAAGLGRRVGLPMADPLDRFDAMMDTCEQQGHRMTFFVIARREPDARNGGYALGDPRVAGLLKRIATRGHEVALHGSYDSIDDEAMLSLELHDLDRAVAAAGGRRVRGMRQHYLRWRGADSQVQPQRRHAPRATARALAAQGLAWDSTLGFADAPGFRCGTSHPFTLFDLDRRVGLPIVERPLVLMEASLLSRHYGGLPAGPAALERAMALREACSRHGGTFTLLWHNDHLRSAAERTMYAALIDAPPPEAEAWPRTQPQT